MLPVIFVVIVVFLLLSVLGVISLVVGGIGPPKQNSATAVPRYSAVLAALESAAGHSQEALVTPKKALESGEEPMNLITTMEEFQTVLDRRGVVLITDKATGDVVHQMPCRSVHKGYFEQKVIINRRKNGSYYELPSLQAAPASARRCPNC
jgi:hypothetical protein